MTSSPPELTTQDLLAAASGRVPIALQAAAGQGLLSVLQDLIHTRCPDPNACSQALGNAAENGHVEAVRLLLPFSRPDYDKARAVRRAVKTGQAVCVELLMPLSRPEKYGDDIFHEAALHGHLDCLNAVEAFVSDSEIDASRALAAAAEGGHVDVVRHLLARSDPTAEKSVAMLKAVLGGHRDVVELLLPFGHTPEAMARSLAEALVRDDDGIATLLRTRGDSQVVNRAFRVLIENRQLPAADRLARDVALTVLAAVDAKDLAKLPRVVARLDSEAQRQALEQAMPAVDPQRARARL